MCDTIFSVFFDQRFDHRTFLIISETDSHLHFDYSFEITQKILQQIV